ncbi:MAG: hypothetical protein H7231_04940, partial [Rhodoferax sp.]|nr:hypothetical protein [Actinomycetota bacterium]
MSTPDRPEDDRTAISPAASAGETPDSSGAAAPTIPVPDVGQDAARRAGRRGRRVLAGAALATGLAVGGAAVAAAVSTGGIGGPGMRGALHGELTV